MIEQPTGGERTDQAELHGQADQDAWPGPGGQKGSPDPGGRKISPGPAARADWERRIHNRLADATAADPRLALSAPASLRATAAVGHVRLEWEPVPDAAGYVVERAVTGDGQPEILRHGGSDVAAVPGTEFADTGITDGVEYRYRVGAVSGAEHPVWEWSVPVLAGTLPSPASGPAVHPIVEVRVDAATVTGRLNRIWHMAGSERLSQLLLPPDEQNIAGEFARALRQVHDDLGVTMARAHAILHDDNAVVVADPAGGIRYDFTRVDAIYDRLLATGVRPVVELSFMPAALARDPDRTVFTYRGIISPPADWQAWCDLVAALTRHLVDRYGIDEVLCWAFEVWNEPNLEVFWSGTPGEYLRLYDEAARAVKSVDARLRVGGPATAAGGWIEMLAAHAREHGSPLDFVSTHTYGNLPLDPRPALRRHGFAGVPLWWTEWGVGSTHFGPIHDGAAGAPFILSGLHGAQDRLDALAYWVLSDHFEELGRPPRLFHNGFGLLSVGNLRKPRYWALHLAAHQGDDVLDSAVSGDGAHVLVRAWATRHDDGTVDVLVWNGTINAALLDGDPRLDRRVELTVSGLAPLRYQVWLARVDARHSNVVAHCPADVDWPDAALWEHLRVHDHLYQERLPDAAPRAAGTAAFAIPLPMPGVARVRLSPRPPTA